MRKQQNQGYEIYNTFKRSPIENDWYIIPLVILGTFLAVTLYAGVDLVFNVMVEFIGGLMVN